MKHIEEIHFVGPLQTGVDTNYISLTMLRGGANLLVQLFRGTGSSARGSDQTLDVLDYLQIEGNETTQFLRSRETSTQAVAPTPQFRFITSHRVQLTFVRCFVFRFRAEEKLPLPPLPHPKLWLLQVPDAPDIGVELFFLQCKWLFLLTFVCS